MPWKLFRRRSRIWYLVFFCMLYGVNQLGGFYYSRNFLSYSGRHLDVAVAAAGVASVAATSRDEANGVIMRKLLSDTSTGNNSTTNVTSHTPQKLYPRDIFKPEQIRHGAILLYIAGIIYMFVALAVVCDEFFVPSLNVIIERLDISEDVAGATFMAAGGSAPELFTSIFGIFVSYSDVGIGTITGSAVFNILFVIGMCALFSEEVLALTWWPLFRDVSFYSLDLILLIVFFTDERIYWWEALLLLLSYATYVIFMKFNTTIEKFVKSKLYRGTVTRVKSTDNLVEMLQMNQNKAQGTVKSEIKKPVRSCSLPILHSGSGRFRHGFLQLMIHTIDPLGEAKVQDKALELHAVATLNVVLDAESTAEETPVKEEILKEIKEVKDPSIHAISNGKIALDERAATTESPSQCTETGSQETQLTNTGSLETRSNVDIPIAANSPVGASTSTNTCATTPETQQPSPQPKESHSPVPEEKPIQKETSATIAVPAVELEEPEEPLDISWPKENKKRISYLLLAPIMFTLWLCLPDVRRPDKKKFFPITFLGSIIWIAIFSYLMVWWADSSGTAINVEESVMGLTILAAGTSIPDLITSVIVAKKGFGDMAVSSSVGSNIFDITVGLPFPWLLKGIISQAPIEVSSSGMFCSIVMLFTMLMVVIICIVASRWRLNKILGIIMVIMYGVFVAISVLLVKGIIRCAIGAQG